MIGSDSAAAFWRNSWNSFSLFLYSFCFSAAVVIGAIAAGGNADVRVDNPLIAGVSDVDE